MTATRKSFLMCSMIAIYLLSFSVGLFALASDMPSTFRKRNNILSKSCGPRALLFVCLRMGLTVSLDHLCQVAGTTSNGTSLLGLSKAAKSVGLQAVGVRMDALSFRKLKVPAIAWVDKNHYLAILYIHNNNAYIYDPYKNQKEAISLQRLIQRSHGVVLTLSHRQ